METPQTEISFFYKNHRGEVSERFVTLDSIEWVSHPDYDYQPGWFISGYDRSREARRSFALTHIVLPDDEQARRFYKLVRF